MPSWRSGRSRPCPSHRTSCVGANFDNDFFKLQLWRFFGGFATGVGEIIRLVEDRKYAALQPGGIVREEPVVIETHRCLISAGQRNNVEIGLRDEAVGWKCDLPALGVTDNGNIRCRHIARDHGLNLLQDAFALIAARIGLFLAELGNDLESGAG